MSELTSTPSATKNSPTRDITIDVPVMVRVEGEGALEFSAKGGEIDNLHLKIYEPPRLFEKFLEGQYFTEVPTMAARICGICPIAYQMTSILAIERLFGMHPGPWVHDMRRLVQCGEWLQSHALHIHLLATPDFLGYNNAIAMAQDHPETVKRGMRLQGLGNALLTLLGGRSVHPIGLRVGGFYRAPEMHEVSDLIDRLEAAVEDARGVVAWTAGLDLPVDHQAFNCVAVHNDNEYGLNEGHIVTTKRQTIAFDDYPSRFKEHQVEHSTAFYSTLDNESYFVGPLARMNVNFDQLPEVVKTLCTEVGLSFPSTNMFDNVRARAVESYYCIVEALRILKRYQRPKKAFIAVTPKAGIARHCTEAPRGLIFHEFALDEKGQVVSASMIPPTSQNQGSIELNLKNAVLHYGLDHSDHDLQMLCEKIIRNYDPCISCSTHFLNLTVHRE
ncbi:Ni/Fe hydrogenase subunit alpha [Teredinibacter purpureus]|uniref:Ni/Fe hydrogenase subunit alpha n=1 Tax=Teredinibacter purpureus TaxID=2731756 RepID=UPI0005F82FB7|nr:nickel-dependent hydrogenase large subunit [Teredinibacter purpureus]